MPAWRQTLPRGAVALTLCLRQVHQLDRPTQRCLCALFTNPYFQIQRRTRKPHWSRLHCGRLIHPRQRANFQIMILRQAQIIPLLSLNQAYPRPILYFLELRNILSSPKCSLAGYIQPPHRTKLEISNSRVGVCVNVRRHLQRQLR